MATIANRNSRNMVQHVLLPVNIHFHWNFHFWIWIFFILVAILKILKTEHNFEWWSIFVSSFKRICCLEWIKKFLHLGYHGNGRHFEFFQPLKNCHTLRWIFLQSFMKFDERNPNFFLNPPLFPWQLQQSLSNRFRFFLAYLVPVDVDVVPIKFHQSLFGE